MGVCLKGRLGGQVGFRRALYEICVLEGRLTTIFFSEVQAKDDKSATQSSGSQDREEMKDL